MTADSTYSGTRGASPSRSLLSRYHDAHSANVCDGVTCRALAAPAVRADVPDSTLRNFDAGSLAAIRKANAGKAFVLAFWSIHCAPCIEDMDDWRALKQKYPDVPIVLGPRMRPPSATRRCACLRYDSAPCRRGRSPTNSPARALFRRPQLARRAATDVLL